MKKIVKYIIVIVAMISVTSCEDYLDTRPDNMLTVDEIFKTKRTTEFYLANIYKYLRCEVNYGNSGAFTAMSDELDVTYADYWVSNFNMGAMTQASGDYMNNWRTMYRGIRSATYFMNNVDNVPIEDGNGMTEKLKKQYKSEARFLRAMFYFYIFRQYGPVIIIGDNVIAPDATIEETALSRATVSETVNFIVNDLNAILQSRTLPELIPDQTEEYGRITEAACRALKARVLLYAASDFYNTDINTPYKTFKDKTGKMLFDYTNEAKTERWQRAVDANLDVINLGYTLYEEKDAISGKINPYLSFKNMFTTDWNSEMIFGRPAGGFWEIEMHSPRTVNAWSGWGPTQELVDIFYTKNGLPIDKDPLYKETGFSGANSAESYTSNNRTFNYTETGTFNMYVDREPRFYATISFDNSRWLAPAKDGTYIRTRYFNGGNSGAYSGRNYSKTGYGIRKHNNPNANVGSNITPEHVEMVFRLGEIYLNYVEALNEVSYANNLPEILTYLNKIRSRAGVNVYGYGVEELPVPANQDDMREAIYRERRIELALEGHRYFDAIRWMTKDASGKPVTHAERDFGGLLHGMAVTENETNFFKRTGFETRVWSKKYNLFPIYINEIYTDQNLVQNPFWDGSEE